MIPPPRGLVIVGVVMFVAPWLYAWWVQRHCWLDSPAVRASDSPIVRRSGRE
jgi:hypothetical protein